ncbi:calcium release activated calcium channel [Trichuris trichiura]|uniref:Calcium release activated calcium channel n=1 Tax=Trichuris trichiura TaxID=36087 RepID=A0A077ZI40_TRITR|nr:calcium release activated calcium channel [Trichuris trichiura]
MDHALSLRQLHLSRAKLKATSQTSALLAGFAMLDLDSSNPSWHPITVPVLITFGVCTTLLVGVHLLALMMSTCMLPHMDSVLNSPNYEVISESPHVRMKWYIELAWCFSTVFGLLLFLLEIGIVFWIKFTAIKATNVTYVTTGILALILVVFLCFTFTFYNKLTMHKYELSKGRLDDLQQYYSTFEPNEEYDVEKVVNAVCKTASIDEVIKVV